MPNDDTKNICVVGAGLSGLSLVASLMEEAQKNPLKKYKIDIIEKRGESGSFIRPQKIVLIDDEPVSKSSQLFHKGLFLRKIDNDEKVIQEAATDKQTQDIARWEQYCKDFFFPNVKVEAKEGKLLCDGVACPLPLNARQKLMLKLLSQPEDFSEGIYKNISIKALQLALKEHLEVNKINNVKIDWYWQANISNINLNENKLSVLKQESEKPTSLKFDTLVICEGTERKVTNAVNDEIQKNKIPIVPFQYNEMGKVDPKTDERKYYPYFCTIRLTAAGTQSRAFTIQDEENNIKDLLKFGWTPDPNNPGYSPDFHVDDNLWKKSEKNWQLRTFLSCEIPKDIYDIKDENERRRAIFEWTKILASIQYDIPKECFVVDTKFNEKLNITSYILNIKSVDNPVRELPNGGHIVLLGDSAVNSYNATGLGSVIVLNASRSLSSCIAADENDFQPYIDRYNTFREYLEEFIEEGYERSKVIHASLFKQSKNVSSLENLISENPEKYQLNHLIGTLSTIGDLTSQIKRLEYEAQNGDDVAAYALATQLKNGVNCFVKKGNYFEMTNYKDLVKSLMYWELLYKKGYPVSATINEVRNILTSFDEMRHSFKRA